MGSAGSLEDNSYYIPSPLVTNYESSSGCSIHEAESNPDDESLSEMVKSSLSSTTSLRTPPPSAKGSQWSLASTDVCPIAGGLSSAMVNVHVTVSMKWTFTKRTTSTPPISPKKKKSKILSAIHTALEQSPKGLLKFLKKCTPAE
jgi:hypothetical protein